MAEGGAGAVNKMRAMPCDNSAGLWPNAIVRHLSVAEVALSLIGAKKGARRRRLTSGQRHAAGRPRGGQVQAGFSCVSLVVDVA